jgi:L-2,4-diaminobutyrate decarboxylase
MTIKHLGTNGYAALTDHCMALSRALASKVSRSNDFEVLTAPDTNIVCFRYRGDLDSRELENRVNTETQRALFRSAGSPLLSSTAIDGNVYLRAVLANPMLSHKHLDRVIMAVRHEAVEHTSHLNQHEY